MNGIERFGLSPLIRFTLLSLYGALVLPLPLLAPAESRWLMVAGLLLGLVLVIGLLSERVETDAEGIQVRYPAWIRWLLRRGWSMRWQDIRALVPVGTSQGGTVYYVKAVDLRHQLLPQHPCVDKRHRASDPALDVSALGWIGRAHDRRRTGHVSGAGPGLDQFAGGLSRLIRAVSFNRKPRHR